MTEPDQDSRRQLRQHMTAQRHALAPQARMNAALGLRQQLETLPAFLAATRVAGYWASAGELPLNLALAPLLGRQQPLYLPCISESHGLSFAPWRMGEDVAANRYGIPEPVAREGQLEASQLDLVLVPLLAFDRSGNRLGSGGGFYDRSFTFLRKRQRPAQPLMLGIGYAFQESPRIEPAPWDVALDYVASNNELINCNETT